MREILFRGKNDAGEWLCGYLTKPAGNPCFIIDGDDYFGGVIEETIGQYTGLTDKNGTKIFEGDIVEVYAQRHICNQQRSQYDVPVKVRAFVEHCSNWNGVGFHFNYKNKYNYKLCQPIGREEDERDFYYRPIQDFDFDRKKKETHPKHLWRNHIEVIGNIHDNPELLEE